VAINDPSQQVTPEMLGQVTFLSQRPAVAANAGEQQPLRIMAPRQLINDGDGGATIWVADVANGVARNASVQLGRAGDEQLVEITSGLTPTDKLIVAGRESLAERKRIRIAGEDPTIGALARVAAGAGQHAK
jgi:multidrug efflux pump subunit AcrA (membrane-fusion protein)